MQAAIATASEAVPDWKSRYLNGVNRFTSMGDFLETMELPAGM